MAVPQAKPSSLRVSLRANPAQVALSTRYECAGPARRRARGAVSPSQRPWPTSCTRAARQMKIQQWARRRAGQPAPQSAIQLLLEGRQGSPAHGYPQHWLDGVSSFYDYLEDETTERVCTGTACRFARGVQSAGTPVHCLGRCYEAPVTSREQGGTIPRLSLVEAPVILRHLVEGARPDPAGEYAALPD